MCESKGDDLKGYVAVPPREPEPHMLLWMTGCYSGNASNEEIGEKSP
jgi:hypothetical protein